MENFLKKIKDDRLVGLLDSVPLGDSEEFRKVLNKFPEYDSSFLWLLGYSREDMPTNRKYVEGAYKKFQQILDSSFPRLFASKGNFDARMWELILCDVLSESGKLREKSAAGADFILQTPAGQLIQIEAVLPNEAQDEGLRTKRPDIVGTGIAEISGNIEDLERPIILRVFDKGFIEKAKRKKYDRNLPLIIAINSSKVTGFVSLDTYVLRRMLFGLGFSTITRKQDGSYVHGLQQNPLLNKPGKDSFDLAVFRDPKYSHVSGVIYTSQSPLGFIPGGYSWHNYGMTFVPNPMATNPVNVEFPFLKKIICNEEIYEETEAVKKFISSVTLD